MMAFLLHVATYFEVATVAGGFVRTYSVRHVSSSHGTLYEVALGAIVTGSLSSLQSLH